MFTGHGSAQRLDTAISRFLLVVAVVTGYGIYRWQIEAGGLEAAPFLDKANATLFSIGIMLAIGWLWHFLFTIAPSLKTLAGRLAVLAIAGFTCVFVIAASASALAAAISGNDAVHHGIELQIADFEGVTSKRGEAVEGLAGALTDLGTIAGKFEADAAAELDRGAITGSRSAGAVHELLLRLTQQLRELQATLTTRQEESKTIMTAARAELAAMRATGGSGLSPTERMKIVSAAADRLRENLNRLDPRPLSAAMVRVLEGLNADVSNVSLALSKDPAIASQQRAAFERLRKHIASTTQPLAALGRTLADTALNELPAFQVLTGSEAIRLYWRSYLTTWAAALILDISPLIGLCLLLLAASEKTRAEVAGEQMLGLTVQELILLQGARASLDGVDPRTLRMLLAALLGTEQKK